MANINIKELLAADTVSELVDKINFNFDQLLLNGGGPLGPQGNIGDIGPIGPRGTIWFTVADLYTTDASPMWTGTPEMVNDINQPSFPQFNGDPNKFLPVGLGGVVESTLVFGTPSKPLRDGDLYIQETDDTLNSFNSFDGDIWEYDGVSESWLYTGVNIKGAQGISGATGFSQWSRINDVLNDIVYPTQESGQDIPKILLGTSTDVIDSYAVGSILTINTEIEHIRLANPIIHDDSNISGESGLITMTSDGTLIIEGSNTTTPSDNKEIIIRGYSNNRIISGEASDPVPTQYVQNSTDAVHEFTGGRLLVKSKNQNNIVHQLLNNESANIGINIVLKPTGASNIHRINADNSHDLVLQGTSRNLGIGVFNNSSPVGSKLSVDGNMSIGSSYKSNTSGPTNGLIVQGNTGIGTDNLFLGARLTVQQTGGSGIVIRNNNSTRSPNMIRLIGFDSNNTWGLGLDNNDSFRLRDNNNELNRIIVTQIGNIGLGINSPLGALSISRNISFPNSIINDSNSFNNLSKSHIKIDSNNNTLVIGVNSVNNSRTAWIQVGHRDTNSAIATGNLLLNPFHSNVGIGTGNNTLSSRFTVNGNTRIGGIGNSPSNGLHVVGRSDLNEHKRLNTHTFIDNNRGSSSSIIPVVNITSSEFPGFFAEISGNKRIRLTVDIMVTRFQGESMYQRHVGILQVSNGNPVSWTHSGFNVPGTENGLINFRESGFPTGIDTNLIQGIFVASTQIPGGFHLRLQYQQNSGFVQSIKIVTSLTYQVINNSGLTDPAIAPTGPSGPVTF